MHKIFFQSRGKVNIRIRGGLGFKLDVPQLLLSTDAPPLDMTGRLVLTLMQVVSIVFVWMQFITPLKPLEPLAEVTMSGFRR